VEREVFELPWFDYWLKGVDKGVGSAPPVTLFVMGKNIWRQENEFPLARTQYRKMYLSSGGHANTNTGDGRLSWDAPGETSSPDQYSYDPDRPVPSTGGVSRHQHAGGVDSRQCEHAADRGVDGIGPPRQRVMFEKRLRAADRRAGLLRGIQKLDARLLDCHDPNAPLTGAAQLVL
jgi:predicted acyl esterase